MGKQSWVSSPMSKQFTWLLSAVVDPAGDEVPNHLYQLH